MFNLDVEAMIDLIVRGCHRLPLVKIHVIKVNINEVRIAIEFMRIVAKSWVLGGEYALLHYQ